MERHPWGGRYALALLCALAVPAFQVAGSADPHVAASGLGRPAGTQGQARTPTAGVVRGAVVDNADRPVPNIGVRLRDMATGRVLEVKRTDAAGRFTFEQVPPGRYVVEALDKDDKVIGIGPPLAASSDGPAETLVRLPGKLKGGAVLFTNAAAAIIAAAAAIGFAAWAQTGQAVSPQR